MQATLTTEQLKQLLPAEVAQIQSKVEAERARGKAELKKQARLKLRRGKVTGSTGHKLFTSGLDVANSSTVDSYVFEKVAEMLGSHKEHIFSASVNWGNKYEAEADGEYIRRTGYTIYKYGDDQEFIDLGDIGATPDGIVTDKNGGTGLIEVKCPYNPGNHVKYMMIKSGNEFKKAAKKDPRALKAYYVQMQIQMYVAKRSGLNVQWCDFVSYDPRLMRQKGPLGVITEQPKETQKLALHIVRVYPDEDFIDDLEKALQQVKEKKENVLKKVIG